MTMARQADPSPRKRFGKVFGLPAVIALVTGVGLIAGLIGDGWFDLVAWIGLAIPAVICVWPLLRPARTARRTAQ